MEWTMKNKFFLLFLLLLISCSTTNNTVTNPFIGTWRSSNNAGDTCQQYIFNSSKEFILSGYNTVTFENVITMTGTYSYTDTEITLNGVGEEPATMSYVIIDNVLTLNSTMIYEKAE
jgi:hypothetical protein